MIGNRGYRQNGSAFGFTSQKSVTPLRLVELAFIQRYYYRLATKKARLKLLPAEPSLLRILKIAALAN